MSEEKGHKTCTYIKETFSDNIVNFLWHVNYSSPLNTAISDNRKFQKCKDLPILSKLDCSCRSPMEVRLIWESSFWICNNIRMCGEKCASDQRISKYPFKRRGWPCMVVRLQNIDCHCSSVTTNQRIALYLKLMNAVSQWSSWCMRDGNSSTATHREQRRYSRVWLTMTLYCIFSDPKMFYMMDSFGKICSCN